MKISIERVDNGYIVRVIKQDCSPLKELYKKSVYVFKTIEELKKYLTEEMS